MMRETIWQMENGFTRRLMKLQFQAFYLPSPVQCPVSHFLFVVVYSLFPMEDSLKYIRFH